MTDKDAGESNLTCRYHQQIAIFLETDPHLQTGQLILLNSMLCSSETGQANEPQKTKQSGSAQGLASYFDQTTDLGLYCQLEYDAPVHQIPR